MLLYISIGGSLGAALRYGISIALQSKARSFPLHTFTVNIIGSLLLGTLARAYFDGNISLYVWAFWGIGFCGAFTTFSTFSYEVVTLIEKKRGRVALFYIASSIIVSLLFATIGFFLSFHPLHMP